MKRFLQTTILLTSVLALFVTFFGAKSVSATTYYVAANGSDSNNGTAKTTPWLHLVCRDVLDSTDPYGRGNISQ